MIRLLLVVVLLAGCASANKLTSAEMMRYDKHTKYNVVQSVDGFTLYVDYSRYQFIPESAAVGLACKQNALALAHEYAESINREIKPIDKLKLSMGRNGLSGITSCSISASVEFTD